MRDKSLNLMLSKVGITTLEQWAASDWLSVAGDYSNMLRACELLTAIDSRMEMYCDVPLTFTESAGERNDDRNALSLSIGNYTAEYTPERRMVVFQALLPGEVAWDTDGKWKDQLATGKTWDRPSDSQGDYRALVTALSTLLFGPYCDSDCTWASVMQDVKRTMRRLQDVLDT